MDVLLVVVVLPGLPDGMWSLKAYLAELEFREFARGSHIIHAGAKHVLIKLTPPAGPPRADEALPRADPVMPDRAPSRQRLRSPQPPPPQEYDSDDEEGNVTPPPLGQVGIRVLRACRRSRISRRSGGSVFLSREGMLHRRRLRLVSPDADRVALMEHGKTISHRTLVSYQERAGIAESHRASASIQERSGIAESWTQS